MNAQPTAIHRFKGDIIGIDWSDGNRSVFPCRWLRGHCPCAECVDEWTGQRRTGEADVPFNVRPVTITPVGRYALSIHWNDGHDAGIYSYRYLRELSAEYTAKGASVSKPACGSRGGAVPD